MNSSARVHCTLTGPPGGAGQPRRLQRDHRAVLAAEAAAEVRHDDAARRPRPGRAPRRSSRGPGTGSRCRSRRSAAGVPPGQRRPRLQRHVRDVGGRVGRVEPDRRRRASAASASPARGRTARRGPRRRPDAPAGRPRARPDRAGLGLRPSPRRSAASAAPRGRPRRRDDADERPSVDHRDARQRRRGRGVGATQPRAVRGRPQHAAVQHAGRSAGRTGTAWRRSPPPAAPAAGRGRPAARASAVAGVTGASAGTRSTRRWPATRSP